MRPEIRPLFHTPLLSAVAYRCGAAEGDAGFDEAFSHATLAWVQRGRFSCACRGRHHQLVPGSLLVGEAGQGFRCSHGPGEGGDACLSFRFAPGVLDELDARSSAWRAGALPPLPAFADLGVRLRSEALDEFGLRLARRVAALAPSRKPRGLQVSAADRRRALRAAEWIEARHDEPLRLDQAAAEVALSPWHFLRVFQRVLGLTPHQYLIRCRLTAAAALLRDTDLPVTEVALRVGFADLSNFVRRFGATSGATPLAFRAQTRRMA